MPVAGGTGGETRCNETRQCRIRSRSFGTGLILLACTIGCHQSTPPDHVARLVDPEQRARMIADFGRGPGALPTPAATGRPESSAALSPSSSSAVAIPSASPTVPRPPVTVGYPRARIAGDTRLVLAAPASGTLLFRENLAVSPSGEFHETVRTDETFLGSSRLVLMPSVQLGAQWTELPTRIVDVDHQAAGPHVAVDLRLPERMAGQTVRLLVTAVAADWGPRVSVRTAPLEIPEHSTLELATGVLEAGWNHGAVRFVVEACADQGCRPLYETRMDPAREADRGWRDASVALDSYSSRIVTLVFRSEPSPVSAETFSLPVWANPTIRVPRKAARSTPNVILLSIDTLSARHLPTYGYFRDTAPVLAREFELGGTVFDACVAAATSTPQAHMSMFTGLQPLEHGITTGMEVLDPAISTITEYVRDAGVATGAVTEDGWLGAEYGFGRGFDEYQENKSADIMAPEGQVDKTFAAAKSWLERHADQRFFLFLHTFQVHDPYAPPAKYTNLFPTDDQGNTIDTDAPSHVREARSYDHEIRYVDDELGSLLTALDELGLGENTVFIVVSDHGEAFLEHGFLRHSTFVFEEVSHVPLLMRGPGVPRGFRVTAPVGHVDLANTIASFFGVAPPRGSRGVDLRRTFRDGNSAVDGGFYFTESWGSLVVGPNGALTKFFPPAFSVRQGQRKTTRYQGKDRTRKSECYDLAEDPAERRNLCPGTATEPADLAATLDAYPDVAARHRARLLDVDGARIADGPGAPMDPEQEQKLRALGYIR